MHNLYFLKQKYNLFLLDLAYSWSFIYKNPLYNLYSYNHSTSSESRLSLLLGHWLVRTFILQTTALVKIINKRKKFLPYAFPWKIAETKVINSAENIQLMIFCLVQSAVHFGVNKNNLTHTIFHENTVIIIHIYTMRLVNSRERRLFCYSEHWNKHLGSLLRNIVTLFLKI